MAYKIIKKKSISELEKEVLRYVSEGWIPTGGIQVEKGKFLTDYHQSIYKLKV